MHRTTSSEISSHLQFSSIPNYARSRISNKVMRNWRTTIAGIIAASGPIIKSTFSEHIMQEIGSALASIGVAALGILAADSKCIDPTCPKNDIVKPSIGTMLLSGILIFWLFMCLTGCATKAILTPQAVQSIITDGTIIGMQAYPEARPGIVVARDIVCANANQTNTNPAKIAADFASAGVTNKQSSLIAYGELAVYQSVYSLIGTNNQAKLLPYLHAFCDGLSAGLPVNARASKAYLNHN